MSPCLVSDTIDNIEVISIKRSRPAAENSFIYVFIRGMWGSTKIFSNWMEMCANQGIDACSITLTVSRETVFDDYVKSVARIARHFVLRKQKVVLVGHSLGGLVAQKVAAERPQLISALIPVASAAPLGIIPFKWFWFSPEYIWTAAIKGNLFKLAKKHAMEYFLNAVDPNVAEEIYAEFLPESGKVLRSVMRGVPISQVSVPTLVIGGEYDNVFSLRSQRLIAGKHNGEFHRVPFGHMIPVEDDGRAFKSIHSFVRGKAQPARSRAFVRKNRPIPV